MPDVHLTVVVREGDWAAFRSPFGATVIYGMKEKHLFGNVVQHEDTEGRNRWRELDQLVFKKAMAISVSSDLLISELKSTAMEAARTRGLLRINKIEPNNRSRTKLASDEAIIRTWLTDVNSDNLPEGATVSEAGLADDDVITICVEHPSVRMYELGPATDPQSLFRSLELGAQSPSSRQLPRLWGVLLYTDSDVEIARYVREQFDDLNALSGPLFRVFVLERPGNWRTAKRYWRANLEPSLYRVFGALQWLKWKPYERYRAYDIARELGIDLHLLPCLVLLRNPGGTSRLTFPIASPPVPYLRRLFAEIERTLDIAPFQYSVRNAGRERESPQFYEGKVWQSAEADHVAFDLVASAEDRIKEALRPVPLNHESYSRGDTYVFHGYTTVLSEGNAMSDNFNFHGPTTFVNRPVDTIIQDFQNTYENAPSREEISQLLGLVLSSRDLPGEAKEEAAVTLHELAADMVSQQYDEGRARSRLEALRDSLSRAADIAAPALEIIGAILNFIVHK